MARTKAQDNSTGPTEPLVPPELPKQEIVAISTNRFLLDTSTPANMWPTNLNPDTAHGKSLLLAATQVPDFQLDQTGSATITATHWLLMPGEQENEETGEVEPVIWAVLFDKDGRMFKTTGVYARSALRAAAALFKPHEWAAGIQFRIASRLTSNKRIAHDVRVQLPESA